MGIRDGCLEEGPGWTGRCSPPVGGPRRWGEVPPYKEGQSWSHRVAIVRFGGFGVSLEA